MLKLITDERIEFDMTYPVGRDMDNVNKYLKVYEEIVRNNVGKDEKLNLLCRGSSGAIIAGILSFLLSDYDTIITHIKKPREDSHYKSVNINADLYNIIVDDFISTGSTVSAINDKYVSEGGTKVHMLLVSGRLGSHHTIDFIQNAEIVACGRVSEDFKEKYNINN